MRRHLSTLVDGAEVEPGTHGLYSPFGHEIAYLPSAQLAAARAGRLDLVWPPVLDDLLRRGFLVEDGFEEAHLREHPLPPPPPATELWLVVTRRCNLACGYCVVEGGRSAGEGAPGMSVEIARAAVIRFLAALRRPMPMPPRVVFYGGEPLLAAAVLTKIVPLVRHLERERWGDHPVQLVVITNGQRYDPALTALFQAHRVAVSVSIDGRPPEHDAARRTPDGAGSHERAALHLKRYLKAGLRVGICTTIGSHNVRVLPEIADDLADRYGVPVQLQVPYTPAGAPSPFHVTMAEAAPYAMEAFARLRRRGILEGLMARRVAAFTSGEFHHRDCGAVGGQLVISPEGGIGPCHSLANDPRWFDGDVRRWDGRLPARFEEWHRRAPVEMPACRSCPAIALCGGGCAYNALARHGTIWARDPQQCAYMRAIIVWLLRDVWAHRRASAFAERRDRATCGMRVA